MICDTTERKLGELMKTDHSSGGGHLVAKLLSPVDGAEGNG